MKKNTIWRLSPLFFFLLFLNINCRDKSPSDTPGFNLNFRDEMRTFVQRIAEHGRAENANFIVIQQNAQDLVARTMGDSLQPITSYLEVIDGISREGLFYGYLGDDVDTPESVQDEIIPYLTLAAKHGKKILITDYCATQAHIDSSYQRSNRLGFISFAATHRELDNIPDYPENPFQENESAVANLSAAKNYLYLINPGQFESLEEMSAAIEKTNYDVIVVDAFFHDNLPLRTQDVERLKKKASGENRLVICYMSIGEAEDYRFYWQESWNYNPPAWILKENPNWPGNYLVLYWEQAWQDIIINKTDSYLNRILKAGFDGVFLDIVDAYEYFEN